MDKGDVTRTDDLTQADAPLSPGAGARHDLVSRAKPGEAQPPTAWCASALVGPVRAAGKRGAIYLASSERRADEIGRALRQFAPDLDVLVLPPWDCLPYDRASPSRECMGRRMAVLSRLGATSEEPRILVASVEALMQRTPPRRALGEAFITFRVGDILDRSALQDYAAATGYIQDDRIDEPGEIALMGGVVDIFPAAASAPVRLALDANERISEIRRYDPLTQRTEEPLEAVVIGPASELVLPPSEGARREPGLEHRAPLIYGKMPSFFEQFPTADIASDPRAFARAADFADQVAEALEARRILGEAGGTPEPDGLYLSLASFRSVLSRRRAIELPGGGARAVPNFAIEHNPGRAFAEFLRERLVEGRRVVLAGLAHELRPLARAAKRGLNRDLEPLAAWSDLSNARPDEILSIEADLEAGFEDDREGVTVVAAADVLGGRLASRGAREGAAALVADPDLRFGDVVIHEDHGLGVLRDLESAPVGDAYAEAARLEYYGQSSLLVPVENLDKVWRYGAEPEAVTLDRLHTDGWLKRRAELSADIDETAARLVELARTRAETKGLVLVPPRPAYARFAARFPYPETPDQAAAIAAVLGDMASGRVMSRLVCGDVGFGKTEVALRAAAAAALSGKQVAVVAPTTVLARQHYETFHRRFAGTGIEVARLSRLASPAELRRVKQGLSDGTIGVVVGTHAIAADDVRFSDLGLLIIDEEQRFGAKLKAALRDLAPDAHLLTMTATPIPRTLQAAMVGVEDVSVIATPPARRRPIRTFLTPWDPAAVRTALLREKRRGGQSFVVVPRIDDIASLARSLEDLAPELSLHIVHGALSPEEADGVMVAFAAGKGDVLLATNIIESGLDVPRANTMVVCRADMFGLAQLHQLRGRVGRGRAQGIAYLTYDPAQELPEATRARLSTLEAFDRLGAGLAISARDLELRGAGDLIGDEQAGHVKLIGTALYQKLLTRALENAKGEVLEAEWTPELNLDIGGSIPESYVPDRAVRTNLYARLARIADVDALETFAEELEDRFGPPPAEATNLLEVSRIRALARLANVARVEAGPKAIALTPREPLLEPPPGASTSKGRIVFRPSGAPEVSRTAQICALLERLCSRSAPTEPQAAAGRKTVEKARKTRQAARTRV